MWRLSVIGAGYLGVTQAVCLAELGYEVIGLDVDETKISRLSGGEAHFHEPGLVPLLRRHVRSGALRFTTSYEDVAEFADVHFLCVDTPQRHDGPAADLGNLEAAVRRLAPLLTRPSWVVGKSTVPVGTAARLAELVRAEAEVAAHVVWNPEFIREGHALDDTLFPDRIVVGVTDDDSAKVVREVYAPLLDRGVPLVVTDLATAELVKSAANAFLATKLSFVNAMAELCEAGGADVTQLVTALGHDPRIGDRYLAPGLGFGGGCLPKDIRALAARAGELGVGHSFEFLRHVDDINTRSRARVADLVVDQCGGSVRGLRVAVLGGSFKPGTDDIRDSPALDVAARLRGLGADVRVYDPVAGNRIRRERPDLSCVDSVATACADADAVVLATEWAEFRELDPDVLGAVVARRRVVDGRHVLDVPRWTDAGWDLRAPGTPARPPATEPHGTEAARTESGRTDHRGTEAARTELDRTEPGRTEADRTEPGRTEAAETYPGRTDPGRTEARQTELRRPTTR